MPSVPCLKNDPQYGVAKLAPNLVFGGDGISFTRGVPINQSTKLSVLTPMYSGERIKGQKAIDVGWTEAPKHWTALKHFKYNL